MTQLAVIDRGTGLGEVAASFRTQPHNIEAEQAVLGAILVNNEAFHRVGEFLRPEHFYEPVHGRIFERLRPAHRTGARRPGHAQGAVRGGRGAQGARTAPATWRRSPRAAETIINAAEYARIVYDLARKRGLIRIGEEVVNRAFDPGRRRRGARSRSRRAERELFELAQAGEIKGGFRAFPQVLTRTVGMIQSALHKSGRVTGVPTGLSGLDEKLGGLQPSDLVILAGRPSMGKTALAVTWRPTPPAQQARGRTAHELPHKSYVVGIFSLEMSAEQLAMRLLSAEAQISSDDLIRRGDHRPTRISPRGPRQPPSWPPARCSSTTRRRSRSRRSAPAPAGSSGSTASRSGRRLPPAPARHRHQPEQNRVQEISEITQGLKALAKELNVPVLALSQLSRAVESREDKRPMLSDLRESGSIEQDADVVMFVYRDDYYLERAEPKQRPDESRSGSSERYHNWFQRLRGGAKQGGRIIAKQRNGPIGTVQLQFDATYGRFRNPEFVNYGDRLP